MTKVKKKLSNAEVNSPNSSFRLFLMALVIAFTTLLLYSGAKDNGFSNTDDPEYVINNPYLHSSSISAWNTTVAGNYHPLTMISLKMDHALYGKSAKSYHITNILLHALNAILVLIFIYMLTGSLFAGGLVSILFAIHPLHVESVAWISERKDLLYTLFYFSSLISYVYYLRVRKNSIIILSIFLFCLSLLSKSQAVTLPLILILIDYWHEGKLRWKMMVNKIPFFALSLAFGIIALSTQEIYYGYEIPFNSVYLRPVYVMYALAIYFLKIIFPFNLSIFYPYPENDFPVLMYIAPAIVIAMFYSLYRFRKNKEVVFGILFFIICLLPVLQFKQFGAAILAERYTYVSSVGILLLMWFVVSNIKANKSYIMAGLTVYTIYLFYVSINQISLWSNDKNLEMQAEEHYPCSLTEGVLSQMFPLSYDTAMMYANKAIQNRKLSALYANRASIIYDETDIERALRDIDTSIQINPLNPSPYGIRGGIYLSMHQDSLALINLRKSLSLGPMGDVYKSMGKLYEGQGRMDSANYYYEKANYYFQHREKSKYQFR